MPPPLVVILPKVELVGLKFTPTPINSDGSRAAVFPPNGNGCANRQSVSHSSDDREQVQTARIDYNINERNSTWYRFQADTGLQAAYTDPINPLFNSVSSQPLYLRNSRNQCKAVRPYVARFALRTLGQFRVMRYGEGRKTGSAGNEESTSCIWDMRQTSSNPTLTARPADVSALAVL